MALGTITKVNAGGRSVDSAEGKVRRHLRTIQLTSGANYTTGGETVTATSVGLKHVYGVNVLGLALPTAGATSRTVGIIVAANQQSFKLLCHTTASAEAASNSDQSTFSVTLEIIGDRAA